jgi:membrane protein DedA with SNARE-associated domain
MLEWMTEIMNALGYAGIVFLMFLENVFPPIPSEIIMPLAGFTATQGRLSFVGVVIAGMVGSVLGALPLYYLGARVGEHRLVAWADRHGRWLTVSGEDVKRASAWFNRHGGKAVFFGRLVPGIRSLISIPAGISEMNLPLFLLYSAIGTGLWAAFLAYLGYLLGKNYEQVDAYLGPVSYIVLGALAAAFAVWSARVCLHPTTKPATRAVAYKVFRAALAMSSLSGTVSVLLRLHESGFL